MYNEVEVKLHLFFIALRIEMAGGNQHPGALLKGRTPTPRTHLAGGSEGSKFGLEE
jgi:hypothetical protein